MSNSKFIIISILLILLLPFVYGGCYAAYSSGTTTRKADDDPQFTGVFVGNTSRAAINSENAVQLSVGALAGGLKPDDSKRTVLNQNTGHSSKNAFRILQLPLMLADALRKIELSPTLIFFNRSDLIIENGRFEGSCGGSYLYTLRLNRRTETLTGRLAFEKYCIDGFTISGKTDVDGSFLTASGSFVSATFHFENLSDGACSMDGEIAMDLSAYPILVTFNAYSTDEQIGQVYWIKDYNIDLYEFAAHVEVEIFGTFYHPDFGYVNLSTSDPFIMHDGDNRPASGQMYIYGEHNTSARLMALDHMRYGVEADSVGDGNSDWESEILNWNDAASG